MRLLSTALLLLSMNVLADSGAAVSVTNEQIRQPMPGRTVTAGYLTLHNQSAQAIILKGASSPAFARTELHQHSHKDGMMRMEQVEQITVDAGESVEFAPGGLHLMFFEPTAALELDQAVPLSLQFADGQQLTLTLPVVAMPKR
ncbi:copper chaperone PCu(A)C [Rheinheimera sp.]|uniref:copper chaperone PCu(A)C n=1 Tax=Rheinheimera sp. TaxID=1869214 RepID=UPI0027375F9F|nr:copper chaperone PCu(A)C [Rheinheimera sp.]MDP2714895.1 copper chaperone PCu(A)C [Rheinheimera sp.]